MGTAELPCQSQRIKGHPVSGDRSLSVETSVGGGNPGCEQRGRESEREVRRADENLIRLQPPQLSLTVPLPMAEVSASPQARSNWGPSR